jgi:hypothetical protein
MWYAQNARKPRKGAVGELPSRKTVITTVYAAELNAAVLEKNPTLSRGKDGWLGEYSRQYAIMNERISKNPKENANIEKLRYQWMNTGPPAAVRRR